ncbi:uncharacterized protein LOC116706110 [Xyrichtys novacula]|uniref:Uncharacterized protein LOC116706110 n=1 Tax=Xyrichtys novacula TaxID=13765 RepID=A0AAV1GXX2_XYRNO|nr:uncharacterized protein LOC116706110 [Xyrichtys novacula]
MSQSEGIKTGLFFIQVLLFTEVSGQTPLHLAAREGEEVTLLCENVSINQNHCDKTSWFQSKSTSSAAPDLELVSLGRINARDISKARSDRLTVATDCSLVIKNFSTEDYGRYTCRQFKRSKREFQDSVVYLSGILMSVYEGKNESIFWCSVFGNAECSYTVQWFYKGAKTNVTRIPVEKCEDFASFETSHLEELEIEKLFCNLTNIKSGQTLRCGVDPHSSCQRTAESGLEKQFITVRVGDEVTLPCGELMKDQRSCDKTTWLYSHEVGLTAEKLVTHGNISKTAISRGYSDRLRVGEDCSLVLENVAREDVGCYVCIQFKPGVPTNAPVFLSVINMVNQEVMFYCSVFTYSGCRHTVQWQYKGSMTDVHTVQSTCSARVTFPAPLQKSNSEEQLVCNVTDNKSGQTHLWDVNLQSSNGNNGGHKPSGKEETTGGESSTKPALIRSIIVSVGLLALIITVVMVNIWTRTEVNQKLKKHDAVDEDEGSVHYENSGAHAAAFRLH